jgi:PAS domain S-box-containing protein
MQPTLSELLDITESQEFLDRLYLVTGLSITLKDLNGRILTSSKGESICSNCRYKTSNTCIKSSVTITAKESDTSQYTLNRCILGLLDGVIKIVLNDEHIGNFHVGNFFFDPPDLTFFSTESKKHIYDESKYLKIVSNTPIISKSKAFESLQLLTSLSKLIITSPEIQNNQIPPSDQQKTEINQFEPLLNSSLEAIIILKDNIIVEANELFAKLYNFSSPQEVVGWNFLELISPESRPIVENSFKSKTPLPIEITGLTDYGKIEVHLQIQSKPVQHEGKTYRFVELLNISRRKTLESNLITTEEKFKVAFKASPYSLSISTIEGVFIEINDGFTKLSQYTEKEVLGRNSQELDLWVNPKEREFLLEKLAKKGFADPFESELRCKSGIKKSLMSARIINIDSKPHILAITQDITDRKLLETQLNQSQKMESIGRLAGGIAHDFNNLLTVILGNTELALLSLPPNSPVLEEILEIKNVANRATNLTKQLLAFCRKQILNPQVVDINKLLLNLDKLLKPIIGEDVSLAILPSDDLCLTNSDPGQIEQVITNLAINGRDSMPDGGAITIKTSTVVVNDIEIQLIGLKEAGNYVLISVTDTGTGIDESIIDQIFEPFFTTKELGKGTGLGLSTCYGIIKQNKGNILVDSTKGVGTTFNIYIPLLEKGITIRKSRQTFSGLALGTENVLIAEDEASVRNMITRTLQNQGYKIVSTIDGEDAKNQLDKLNGEIDLVITDVIMPKMGGKQLSEYINTRYPHIKVLFMSGYSENSVIKHGNVENDISFIQKPFTIKALLKKVRYILDFDQ